jgi:hypothetical protein
VLEGYSRTVLAGAIAPAEARWIALMVLYTASVRYGAPETLVSDSGRAYTSNDFEAVCARLRMLKVLGEATGHIYSAEELNRARRIPMAVSRYRYHF